MTRIFIFRFLPEIIFQVLSNPHGPVCYSSVNQLILTIKTRNNMNEFLLLFRADPIDQDFDISPEQIQAMMKPWQDWMGSLAAQNKLVNSGNRLASAGSAVKPNNVIFNGPFVAIKEARGGYIIIRADSIDEAAKLSKGCPIVTLGGNVEVRTIVPMD